MDKRDLVLRCHHALYNHWQYHKVSSEKKSQKAYLFGQQGLQLPILHCLSLGLDFDVLIYILSLAALTNYFNIHDMLPIITGLHAKKPNENIRNVKLRRRNKRAILLDYMITWLHDSASLEEKPLIVIEASNRRQ